MPKETTPRISVPFPEEPGAVWMTPGQWDLFRVKLTEPCAYYWCERAEDYAVQWPKRWARYKDHYRTLLNWHQMKVGDGYVWYLHPEHGPGYYKMWIVEKSREARR